MPKTIDLRKYCDQPVKGPTRKGRSEVRLSSRDEKMIARFYYYAHIRKLNYSSTLSRLSEEFDIDENVVRNRMKIRQDLLDKVFGEKPTLHLLKKTYPYYAW